ncbi:MAG: Gfo/Idh/MocA family oxidoreductase [Ignavibacteriaceae bacterium]
MPKPKIKWGVAGLGRYSEHSFIPTMSLFRRSVINSVFSNDINRAKNIADKFGINNKFSNYDEFLNSDINAVYIGSANSYHYEQVIKAAEAGKNILCEKPLALNSVQADEMVRTCKEKNVLFAVNYLYRFHPQIIKTKELIENKLLGKIISINLSFNIDLPPGDNFRHNIELSGGGALRDLGTHLIDTLRFLGGEFDIIGGIVDSIIYKSGVDDFASALIKFKKSGYGYFNCSYNSKKAFNRLEILGHKGAISIDSFIGAKHAPSKLTIMLDGEAKRAFRKRGNKLYYLLKSVQKSFLMNEEPLVTGYDGYVNLKLMEELEEKCRPENI